nr:MAG TPA: hypothetical protein [Caudoviricetes sp.]
MLEYVYKFHNKTCTPFFYKFLTRFVDIRLRVLFYLCIIIIELTDKLDAWLVCQN